jgi:O-antigen/teichoic acid export membrane protein
MLTGWAASLVAHMLTCLHAIPALRARPKVDRAQVPNLMGFGGWMTVSNVIAPLFVSVDRFLIGAWVSMSAVAFYATPYEMATRMWIVATPLASVLFPAFAVSHAYDRERMERLFFRGVKYVLISLFPAVLIMVTLAHEGLALWLGEEFARKSTDVLQLLAVGVFVNSLAQIAFALVQGAGRPRLTALLHLVELPLYLSAAWWLIHADGIRGAATAWAARMTFDAG